MSSSAALKKKTFFDAQALTDVATESSGKDTRGALYDAITLNVTAADASAGLVVTVKDSDDGQSYLASGFASSTINSAGVSQVSITRPLRRFVRLSAVCASGKTATITAWLPYSEARSVGAPAGDPTET